MSSAKEVSSAKEARSSAKEARSSANEVSSAKEARSSANGEVSSAKDEILPRGGTQNMNKNMEKITDRQFLREQGKSLLGGIAGMLLYAIGMNCFIVPVGLYSGGLMGFCQLIRTLLIRCFPLLAGMVDIAGIIYYLLNIPLILVAIRNIGKKFVVKTILCVTAMTIFLSVIPIPLTPIMEDDILASCLIGGILCGAGLGIPLRMSCSSGGMDILGLTMIKLGKNFSLGKINLLVNAVLYGICLFLFDVPTVIYSLIYASVSAMAVDRLHSQNINVEVTVVTNERWEEMEKDILAHMDRGITKWNAKGAYTEADKQVLYIMVSKYELVHLKYIIKKHDPHAFIVVNEGVNISGHFLKKL